LSHADEDKVRIGAHDRRSNVFLLVSREEAVVRTDNLVARAQLCESLAGFLRYAGGAADKEQTKLRRTGIQKARDEIRPDEIGRKRLTIEQSASEIDADAVVEDLGRSEDGSELLALVREVHGVRIAEGHEGGRSRLNVGENLLDCLVPRQNIDPNPADRTLLRLIVMVSHEIDLDLLPARTSTPHREAMTPAQAKKIDCGKA
jgi:hypothetical protein